MQQRPKKKGLQHRYKPLFLLLNMARPARFERATAWFVARYSIQLSYGRLIRRAYYSDSAVSCQWLIEENQPKKGDSNKQQSPAQPS